MRLTAVRIGMNRKGDLMKAIREGFMKIGEAMLELTPEERRELLDFHWPDMFAWWDDKPYYESKPMIVRGLGLSHAEARFVWLLLLDLQDGGVDCGTDPEDA